MWIAVVSLFPEMFKSISDYGVSGRALSEHKLSLSFWNPRDFSEDKHKRVDDRPFGGGPGMVMQVAPLVSAIQAAKKAASEQGKSPKVIYLSPQGQVLKHKEVKRFSELDSLILLAGRYEGIDERVINAEVDEEWSIGDYVLSGGELPCMVLIDAISRQLPGVLGHAESAKWDSFSEDNLGLLDCPHYTRPETILGMDAPPVLMSGHHAEIKQWRLQQSLLRTWQRRPDLLPEARLDNRALELLEKIKRETREEHENRNH